MTHTIDPDFNVRMRSDVFEGKLDEAVIRGYEIAIRFLMSKEADQLHEMYASGFAGWLEEKKSELRNG
jgi:hypothetical protein